jgi:hypothetical protein
MKKIVLTIFAFALAGSLMARSGSNSTGKKDSLLTQTPSCEDSLSSSVVAISNETKDPVKDSTLQSYIVPVQSNYANTEADEDSLFFASNDFYNEFDTEHIHSFNLSADNFKDTTCISLVDQNSCGYVHPFNGYVTSGFGPRRMGYHLGIDIKLEVGDTVVCAFDGKVRIARRSSSYGNVVVVRHNNGLETYYAHLSAINVEVGQYIKAGESIGLGGNTGHSTGSHLHFEVRFKGHPLNPSELISFTENRTVCNQLEISSANFEYLKEFKKFTEARKYRRYKHKKRGRYAYAKKGKKKARTGSKYATQAKAKKTAVVKKVSHASNTVKKKAAPKKSTTVAARSAKTTRPAKNTQASASKSAKSRVIARR